MSKGVKTVPMRVWIRTVVLVLCVSPLVTGCWNSRELNTLAIVMGMGIDLVPDTHEYLVSFQIVNPAALGTKGAGGNINSIAVYSGVDQTLFGALRKTSQKVPRRLMFAHTQLLVIGEDFARQSGIKEIFDFFERSHEYRLNSNVVIARETDARSVLEILTPLEKSPAKGITRRVEISAETWGGNLNVEMLDVVQDLESKGDPVISGMRIIGNPEEGSTVKNLEQSKIPTFLETKGIGLFKDGKLITWLDETESRGVMLIKNMMVGTVINVPCNQDNKYISLNSIRSETKVSASLNNGRPTFTINIDDEGSITEVQCSVDLSDRAELVKIQELWSDEIERYVLQAWDAARSHKTDIFGFGEQLARHFPNQWRNMEKDWPNIFADSKINIHVDTYIRRTGMRTQPSLMYQ